MQSFRAFLESIDLNKKEVIIPKGEILYHGTLESFDTRKPRTGGYDNVFWTTDDITIARMYIPANGSYYLRMSIDHILNDKNTENIRKSLGLTNSIKALTWKKGKDYYDKVKFWDQKNKEYTDRYHKKDFDEEDDDFYSKWIAAEDNYKSSQKNAKSREYFQKQFVIMKMKTFGYEPKGYNNESFERVLTDEKGYLVPANKKAIGKVLKVICNREFKLYNQALGKEGDLTDVDYNKLSLMKNIEEKGYDGIIINDFAQSNYHGNYGHLSFGFFKNSIKDLTIKQIRNQTHPNDEEFKK